MGNDVDGKEDRMLSRLDLGEEGKERRGLIWWWSPILVIQRAQVCKVSEPITK